MGHICTHCIHTSTEIAQAVLCQSTTPMRVCRLPPNVACHCSCCQGGSTMTAVCKDEVRNTPPPPLPNPSNSIHCFQHSLLLSIAHHPTSAAAFTMPVPPPVPLCPFARVGYQVLLF